MLKVFGSVLFIISVTMSVLTFVSVAGASYLAQVSGCENVANGVIRFCERKAPVAADIQKICPLPVAGPSTTENLRLRAGWVTCVKSYADRFTQPCLSAETAAMEVCHKPYMQMAHEIDKLEKEIGTNRFSEEMYDDPVLGPKINKLGELRQLSKLNEASIIKAQKYGDLHDQYKKFIKELENSIVPEDGGRDDKDPKPGPVAKDGSDDRAKPDSVVNQASGNSPNLPELVGDTSGLRKPLDYTLPAPSGSGPSSSSEPARLGSESERYATSKTSNLDLDSAGGAELQDLAPGKPKAEISKTSDLPIQAQSGMAGFQSNAGSNLKPKGDEAKNRGVMAQISEAVSKISQGIFGGGLGAARSSTTLESKGLPQLSAKQLRDRVLRSKNQRIPAKYNIGAQLAGRHSSIFRNVSDRYSREFRNQMIP